MHENGVDAVEIRVYHERRTAAQIHVLLPPIGHVVGGPPGLEDEVALELHGDAVLELRGQFLHAIVVLVVEKGTHATQVLRGMFVEIIAILKHPRRLILPNTLFYSPSALCRAQRAAAVAGETPENCTVAACSSR